MRAGPRMRKRGWSIGSEEGSNSTMRYQYVCVVSFLVCSVFCDMLFVCVFVKLYIIRLATLSFIAESFV
jgi:hypothetical protein